MTVRVDIPTVLRQYTDGERQVAGPAPTCQH